MKKIAASLILICAAVFAQDSFTDSRDSKKYKTAKIGEQIWMAENLDYSGENNQIGVCYNNEYENCEKYGSLYSWKEAMEVCPSGWHLPSKKEWEILLTFVSDKDKGGNNTGKKLKAKKGWESWKNKRGKEISGNGTDNYGFAALPGGWEGFSVSSSAGEIGNWWGTANSCVLLSYKENSMKISDEYRGVLFSVRCIKD